jgi:hypothetical protein
VVSVCPGRLEFVKCFIGKTPGRHKVFLLHQLKRIRRIKEMP